MFVKIDLKRMKMDIQIMKINVMKIDIKIMKIDFTQTTLSEEAGRALSANEPRN